MTDAPDEKDYSEFIREFVTDPANVPDVACLYGYLGQSTEEGHERLYQTPSLTPYIEIPAKAILRRQKAAREDDPLGGVTLWVRRDANLIYKMTPTAQAQASYFAGALQANAAAYPPNMPIDPRWTNLMLRLPPAYRDAMFLGAVQHTVHVGKCGGTVDCNGPPPGTTANYPCPITPNF